MFEIVPPRSTEVRHYPAVWKCIYCGETNRRLLTDEHIIPLSLGGVLILDKSSCVECNKITKAFEQTIARTMYGPFRVVHNLPTRRPKERPTHFKIGVVGKDGISRQIKIPASEYHASTFTYKFTKPKLLIGLPPVIDTLEWVCCINASTQTLNRLTEKYGWDRLIRLKTTPFEFARLLAKVAHAYCAAEIGIENFHPLLPDLILGKSQSHGYFVGGTYDEVNSLVEDLDPPIEDAGHLLQTEYVVGNIAGRIRALLVVRVRLFASLSNPTYLVVAGEVNSPGHVAAMVGRMAVGSPSVGACP